MQTTNTFLLFQVLIFICLLITTSAASESKLILSSPVFKQNGFIPQEYTCQGQDINPELRIENVPAGTQSLVLIVDDPDAPVGVWVHWVVVNISPDQKIIDRDTLPGIQGGNDFGRRDYGGPCPPSGVHRYFFKLYALDRVLDLKEGVKKDMVEAAMEGHILDQAELIGRYMKK